VIFILQEALSNVRKHAQAHRVDIDIDNHDDFVMRISDDGCGFDAAVLAARQARHVGMSIMQERASRINARIQIENRDGGGTTVTLTLPHTERQAA
jgi:two-component system nitrate/nitrite sensor histidine kinase NarX